MGEQISAAEKQSHSTKAEFLGFDEVKLKEIIGEGKLDFDGWNSLILDVENSFPDEIEKISLVYDSFLSEFPLSYGYWRKYVEHVIRLSNADKAVQVFERAVQSATYCVGVWVDYCAFAISVFEDANDIRRLFKRAVSYVGKDYLCHTLWDKYLEFEFSQQQWSSLANVYIQTLRFPSKKLHRYYESFQKLTATWKEEMQCLNDLDLQSDSKVENEVSTGYTDKDVSCVIQDLLDASTGVDGAKALEKYLSIGKKFYQEASQLEEKIHGFETSIGRPYFHVKPLEVTQLEKWHEYLNFVEMHGDFDWAVKLYERCLIPCANYPEFWMRYADYMESKGGREIANYALARATQIFLKRLPMIHLFTARFREKIRDVSGAHVALLKYDTGSDLSFVETVSIKANMEKRLGNFIAASNTYKEALEIAAAKEKFDILPTLYIHFSRLQYMITSDSDAARDILIDGIKCLPHCKLLLEELIKFGMMHGGSRHIDVLDALINDLISPGTSQGMSAKEAEDISNLYLQFVDLCGTIDDIRKAWNRHMKCFPESMRISAYISSVDGTKLMPLNVIAGRRQESIGTLPSSPPNDGTFDGSTQPPSQDKILKQTETSDTHLNLGPFDRVLDKKSPLHEENHEIFSDQTTGDRLQSGEVGGSIHDKMQQRSQDVPKQLGDDIGETNLSPPDLMHEVTNELEALQASIDNSKAKDVQQEHDNKPEQDVHQLSLEKLSLDHLDNKSLDSVRAANQESETFLETGISNGSMVEKEPPQEISISNVRVTKGSQSNNGDHQVSSPRSAQASDFEGMQTEIASPTSSQLNIKKTEPLLQRSPPYAGGSWQQRSNNADRVQRESKLGFRRHSHKRHHTRQLSPRRHYPQSETGPQVPISQGYPSQPMSSQSPQVQQQGAQTQNQYPTSVAHPNVTMAQAWSMQNMQQQNFFPGQSQLLPQPCYPQPQFSQHLMQSTEQLAQMQNNEAYNNQMWQYYFYQQQQQQQFLLQQQQQQPQNQQPQPQQQLLHQQYQQHQQMLQVQQQYLQPQLQQQLPYQQPQLQLQQQQQFIQQQQYLHQQQQELLHQQGSYPQQFPPQNHHLHLQPHLEQQQTKEEQITTSQVPALSDLSKEDRMMESRLQTTMQGQDKFSHRADASETVSSAISPNSQQRSNDSVISR